MSNTLQLYKKVPNQISTNLENSIANPLRYWSGQTGKSNTWEEDKMRKLRETGGFYTYTHTKGTCQAEQQAGQDERFYLLIFHIRNESRSRRNKETHRKAALSNIETKAEGHYGFVHHDGHKNSEHVLFAVLQTDGKALEEKHDDMQES